MEIKSLILSELFRVRSTNLALNHRFIGLDIRLIKK